MIMVITFYFFLSCSRHFKEKMQQQMKRDEAKWKLLVSKVIAAKNLLGAFSGGRSGLL